MESSSPESWLNFSTITVNRESKLLDLKKNIAWACCSNLLVPPLRYVGPLVFSKISTEDERKQLRLEHDRELRLREEERVEREPELLRELEKIIERIKQTRSEYQKTINYASIAEGYNFFNFLCNKCGNKNAEYLITDPRSGDVICNGRDGDGCGHVVHDHSVNMGAAKRNFEGEEEKNHFGPAPSALMPDAWNMSTSMLVMKNGRDDPAYKKLSQTAQTVEMDLSNIGSDEHRTREGYKSRQKRHAFDLIDHLSDNLNLHASVKERAKQEFSKYRDVREAVQQYEGVVASCVVLAYQELSIIQDIDVKERVFSVAYMGPPKPPLTTSIAAFQMPTADMSDPAEATLSHLPMGKWSLEQVSTWLLDVSASPALSASLQTALTSALPPSAARTALLNPDAHIALARAFADDVVQHIRRRADDTGIAEGASVGRGVTSASSNAPAVVNTTSANGRGMAGKRKYPEVKSSFLGTTTIAGRRKRTYTSATSASALQSHPPSSSDADLSSSTGSVEAGSAGVGRFLVALKLHSVETAALAASIDDLCSPANDSSMLADDDGERDDEARVNGVQPMQSPISAAHLQVVRCALERHVGEALRRRATFEVRRRAAEDNAEKESRRLAVETTGARPRPAVKGYVSSRSPGTMETSSGSRITTSHNAHVTQAPPVAVEAIKTGDGGAEEADNFVSELEDMMNADFPVSSSSCGFTSASALLGATPASRLAGTVDVTKAPDPMPSAHLISSALQEPPKAQAKLKFIIQ